MTDTSGYAQAYQQASDAFGKFVPGFEFLQGLVRNAGKSMPSMGQWIAPTLDPEELERRIEELKTVQFWLEQNARMIGATVQALEVQRMTLGALKGMNVSMGDLSEALKVKVPDLFAAGAEAAAAGVKAAATPSPAAAPAASKPAAPIDDAHSDDAPASGGSAGAIDPMQWWGALTEQFTTLASQAMQATSEAARQATEAARQASEATSDAAAQAVQAAQAAQAATLNAGPKPAPRAPAKAAKSSATKAAPTAANKAAPKAAVKSAAKNASKAAAPRKASPRSSS